MTSVVFYFQVHQPYRLRRYAYSEVGESGEYFDDYLNKMVCERVAERCYLPMNALLLEAIERTEGRFRCAFSISGTALGQFQEYAPHVLDSFRALVETGAVELLCETSMHSLAALADPEEFELQVERHLADLDRLFGVRPTTFRDTELIVDEEVARQVEALGFDVLLGEGADGLLGWRTPHLAYRPRGCERLNLLLRDYEHSDDIAFRFSNETWAEFPLHSETFARWLGELPDEASFAGLFMDYETFGEHQPEETGIFEFMRALPHRVLENPALDFATPAEVAARHPATTALPYPRAFSWADAERGLAAWLGNPMQRAAHRAVYDVASGARAAALAGAPELYETWRRLTTSDHTYYMATNHAADSDGDVHAYFSPYDTPHDAFVTFMNVLEDLRARIEDVVGPTSELSPTPS